MPTLSLSPKSAAVAAYYQSLKALTHLGVEHEMAVRPAFATLLQAAARPFGWELVAELSLKIGKRRIAPDGTLLDIWGISHGHWEAKDTKDKLDHEIADKLAKGYPTQNLLFWTPQRVVLYQHGQAHPEVLTPWDEPARLLGVLKQFLEFAPEAIVQWEAAVEEFKDKVPELGRRLAAVLKKARKENPAFAGAFAEFVTTCRTSLNPNLSEAAVEEMLVQHLLTERILRKIFNIEDFRTRNAIAADIEKVIGKITEKHFRRDDFLQALEPFYLAIETAAGTFQDFTEKQKFLNLVYERFFQGFAVQQADVLGVVYTPQPLVQFMIRSVEHVLREQFDTSLDAEGVHIFDPFTGTGNFIVNLMQHISGAALKRKYAGELHCNEVSLLPYYVASMNIEHAYYERMGQYEPFEGICLVDTFETVEKEQAEFEIFNEVNSERVKRQRAVKDIRVIIANPPYNAGQLNENDNNKNRKYPEMDGRVKRTYAADGTSTLQRKLWDPYIKAIRYASDRLGDAGVVCYVNNNSFVTENSFDGMRKHLEQDFDLIYILDLGGNVRKHPALSGTTHNVFGIQVGVSINLFIRLAKGRKTKQPTIINYYATPLSDKRGKKYEYLDAAKSVADVQWKKLEPTSRYTWIVSENEEEYSRYIPVGSRDVKAAVATSSAIAQTYCPGVNTARDSVVYDFNSQTLASRCEDFFDHYNAELERWRKKANPPRDSRTLVTYIDNFVNYEKIKWSETLKRRLVARQEAIYQQSEITRCLYRPFTTLYLYCGSHAVDRPGAFSDYFPAQVSSENRVLCVPGPGSFRPYYVLMSAKRVSFDCVEKAQCFPLYTYSGESKERRDNIPLSTLNRFSIHYDDPDLTREDIFYYVYGVLHHPDYRTRYAENLKRELPRIPMLGTAADFHAFAAAGRKLADLHVGYESVQPYKLRRIENADEPVNWRVEAMKMTKDERAVVYNKWLTLDGIPPEALTYRLGNRSALGWVIDQYRVARDAEGEIVSDPNVPDDEEGIVRLVGQVVAVSVETMKIIQGLPVLALP